MSNTLTLFVDGIINYLLFTSVITAVLTSLAVVIIKMARIQAPIYRHQVWLYCLIGIIFLPAICLYGPKLTLAVLPAHTQIAKVPADADGIVLDVPAVEELSDEIYLPLGAYAETAAEDNLKPQTFTIKSFLATLWFVGVVFMVARLIVGWYRLRRVCLSAEAVSGNGRLGNRNVRILLTSQVQGPVCFGLFRGIILLPRQMYKNTAADKLEMIVNHELAHIERKDYLANLFQRVIEAILFFHPFIWYASLQLTQQREQICDNYVLAEGASANDYSVLLTRIVERAVCGDRLGAVALIEGRLLSRVRFLLNPSHSKKTRLSGWTTFVCTLMVLVCFLSFGSIRLAAKTDTATETTTVKSDKTDIALTKLRRESNKKLRRLGLLLAMYAADHQGEFPDNLFELGPYASEEDAAELGPTVEEDTKYVGDGKTTKDSPQTVVIAYDKSLLQKDNGTNALFADGHVEYIRSDELGKLGIIAKSNNLEVLDIKIDPIRQGKNVVRVKVENNSGTEQTFGIHIQTRSPDYGRRGVGWGRPFFDEIGGGETKWVRCAFRIQGPITEATWIRLHFYNPLSVDEYDSEKYFKKNKYFSSDLKKLEVVQEMFKPATKRQSQLVIDAFRRIQSYLRDEKYEEAWQLFTKNHKDAAQINLLERFIENMEEVEYARFFWEKGQFVELKPKAVTARDEVLTLKAIRKDQVWAIDFVREDEQWKIDWVAGYTPTILIQQNWEKLLLPTMEKRVTKHFDIYYYKDSTAEKELDEIVEQKEKGFDEICQFLEKDSNVRIRMVFFEDGRTKQISTGHQGAGWAFGNTIVEIYNEEEKLDPYHETVHILMGSHGNPPALFNEGFATYMSERLGAHGLESLGGGQSSIYQRVRELKSKNEWIPLEELITYTDIGPEWSRPPVSYAEAGAFVKFLIDTYGKDKFLQAYNQLLNSDSKQVQEKNIEKLTNIYGKSLNELKKRWEDVFLKSPNP